MECLSFECLVIHQLSESSIVQPSVLALHMEMTTSIIHLNVYSLQHVKLTTFTIMQINLELILIGWGSIVRGNGLEVHWFDCKFDFNFIFNLCK